jgi:hypothetical protein
MQIQIYPKDSIKKILNYFKEDTIVFGKIRADLEKGKSIVIECNWETPQNILEKITDEMENVILLIHSVGFKDKF